MAEWKAGVGQRMWARLSATMALCGCEMRISITGRLRLLLLILFGLLAGIFALSLIGYDSSSTGQQWLHAAQGTLVVAALVVLCWGHHVARRHVVEPLKTMGTLAQQMATGTFTQAIPEFPDEELGRLASAMEDLRVDAIAHRAQLEDQVSRRTRELEAAFELSQEINAQLELDRLLESVTVRARRLMHGSAAALCLVDEEAAALRLAAGSGEGEANPNLRQPITAELPDQVIGHGKTVVSETACANCGFLRGLKSGPYVATPLRVGDASLGALCVARSHRADFEPEEQAAFSLLANAAAGAIVNARLAEERRAQTRQAAIQDERERLAEELHDNLAQTLSFLNLKCDKLEALIAEGATAEAERELAQMRGATTRAYGQVRAALTGLQAAPPEIGSFALQLAACVEEVRTATGVAAELMLGDASALALPAVAQRQAVHIVREALLNAWRHADASRVTVRVDRANGEAVFTVEDNGRGFDPLCVDRNAHLGLVIMRERAERTGGTLCIDSTPGGGTRVVARFGGLEGS